MCPIPGPYLCQPFSAAGKRGGADDAHHLWPEVARVIRECAPEWVFLENVAGHVSLGLETALREFWGMGYTPAAGLFSAAEVGAPHQRLRIFILAHTDEPASGHGDLQPGGEQRFYPQSGSAGAGHHKLVDAESDRWREGWSWSELWLGRSTTPACTGGAVANASGRRSSRTDAWQRAALGCKVDGGQHKMGSYTHADAEVIAATVAGMPDNLGGIRMAISVAEMARAGITPDWMPGVVPRCVPMETKQNQHGERAATIVVGFKRIRVRGPTARGTWKAIEILACPVTWRPHPEQIASARRGYDDWWQALDWVRDGLMVGRMLREVEVTAAMPKVLPWKR